MTAAPDWDLRTGFTSAEMSARWAQRAVVHPASSTVCAERPAADGHVSPPAVVPSCFQFPSPRKLRGSWLQQQTADGRRFPIRSCHLQTPQTQDDRFIRDVRLRPQRAEDDGSLVARVSPWLQPWPGTCRRDICRRGFCRRGTCRRGTCQLARSEQPAEDEGVRSNRGSHKSQRGSPNDHEFQHSKSPAVTDGIKINLDARYGHNKQCPQPASA